MLEELSVRNLGPIHSARITPAAGLTAITGETGAGKSMLLSAIRLISGGTASGSRVSSGAGEAWAQGVFSVGDGANGADGSDADAPIAIRKALAYAEDAGITPEDGELFLSRVVPASGRSRAVLGGKTVPRSVLESVADELITVHGQTDQLRIASAARQREFLDMAAGDDEQLDAYHHAWEALAAMDARLAKLRSQEAAARQQADYLRESIERINQVDPQPGEDKELKDRRDRIENAAAITQGVSSALASLDASQVSVDSDAVSAVDLVNRAVQALHGIRVGGVFEEQAARLESIAADLTDVVFALAQELGGDGDVEDLDRINGRIHELNELMRRWGPELSDVIAWRDKAAFDVEDLDASPEKVAQLEDEREHLYREALTAAEALHDAREQAAERLGAHVSEELESLAMSGASLRIRVAEHEGDGPTGPLGPHGGDDIEFLFTPFPGSPELPMGKSASGGELSRLMLALELVAAEQRGGAGGMTFIFDEVDAGVGGKAAVELGRRLARLAEDAQVIVVTHLAQVASWADRQFVVAKAENPDAGVIETTVTEVTGEARTGEIARMLSGSATETSLDHARELLAESTL
ncbi:DNA repair protein RecN [Bifidobacterium sp. 64T4]|uniref:DNA repair protein RecN n=1 Tax=Bifidobacterium pongonis TaxID=2834432 RepID=UPI001C567618|nr:DNA repair protein RecN [Bifidobacterium pongonis]MBW3095096.1 DNA repair protein RecN [Bifidobacterium pongonis]